MRVVLLGKIEEILENNSVYIDVYSSDDTEKEIIFTVRDSIGNNNLYRCKARGNNAEKVIKFYDDQMSDKNITVYGKGSIEIKEKLDVIVASMVLPAKELCNKLNIDCPKEKENIDVRLIKREKFDYKIKEFILIVENIEL